MEDHVKILEKRFVAFDKKKAQLEVLNKQLLPIIHQPGWTTVAEFRLIELVMQALESHADHIVHLQSELIQAARLVGTGVQAPAAVSNAAANLN